MSLTVSISKKLSCCESNATSPSCCERYRRVLVMFEAVVLIHSSYQTDPVRYTPELRGVVPAIAARNVDFPAPLCFVCSHIMVRYLEVGKVYIKYVDTSAYINI